MASQAENEVRLCATPAFVQMKVAEMRGSVVHCDGRHGVIRTDDGIEVNFFPVHLTASGYVGQVKVGDHQSFRCNVISSREYCLDRIRVVAVA
jgi:hypothetical protein